MRELGIEFTATLQRSVSGRGWAYVIMPDSEDLLGTKRLVEVTGTIDGHPFHSTFTAFGDGVQKLPIRAEVHAAIGRQDGDQVTVRLDHRLD